MLEYEKLEPLTEGFKAYIKTNVELIKLEMEERISVVGSGLIATLAIVFAVAFSMLFISLSAAFYLSARFGNSYIGFALVGGFYLLVGVLLLAAGKGLIERPMRDKIIEKILSR